MLGKCFWTVTAFAVLIFVWEYATQIYDHMLLILPPPSGILYQMTLNYQRLFYHSWETFKVMIGGIFLSLLVAFPIAWMMSLWSTASIILQPIFVIAQCIPMFALAPMMVLWFGWSYTAVVIPTTLMIFLPLTMNIYQGIKSTPIHFIEYFRIHQATPWQMLYKLQVPWALSNIFAGLRVAAAIAGIGAIAGEWAGAQAGIGMLMLETRRGADLEMMFAALFCLMLLSLSLYGVIALIERQLFRRKFVHLAQKAVVISSCLLTLLGMSSCQSNSAKNETRLVLDWLPNPNHVPLYVGIEKGFFEKRGIKLHLLKIHDASDPLPHLASGQTELAISYMPSAIHAINQGANLKPIALLIPEPLNALIYRRDSGIKVPSDLNGKTFGYCVDGFGTKGLNYLLSVNQIIPKEKQNVSFDLVMTLGLKKVDVVYGAFWNIECEQLRSLGIETEHFKLTDLGIPTYFELVVMAREGSHESTPQFVMPFREALQESIDFCQLHPSEAFSIYVKANPDKSEKTRKWEYEAWQKTLPLFAQDQIIDTEVWNSYAVWLLKTASVNE